MKAVVMSHEHGGSYVLCSNGDFRFAKGYTSRSVGAEVEIESQPLGGHFKIVAMAACLVIAVILGVFASLWHPWNKAENYFIYIDINPSVELTYNHQNELKTVKPLNDDSVTLLDGLMLQGPPEKVVIALLQEATRKGYLDENGDPPYVFITVTAKDDATAKAIMCAIVLALNEYNMQGIAVVEVDNMDLRCRADELGVPPGKLKLAEKLFALDQSVPIDEIVKMSVEDLAIALKAQDALSHSHVWGGWVVTTPPTCATVGKETRVCANDPSHIETRNISALDHAWGVWAVTLAPTCDAAGIETRVCANNSSHVETRNIPALGHAWGGWVVTTPATCDAVGVETRVCANNPSHVETRSIPALGHAWGGWVVTTPATCDTIGIETRICANDPSHIETRSIPALDHAWGGWVVTTPPTCDAVGTETRVCANDPSHIEIRSIPALDHAWGGWVVTTPPTCDNVGIETRICANDPSHIETRSVAALGHVWGAWGVTLAPTCDAVGIETRICFNDPSHIETREIPALGHAWDDGVVIDPTDTSDGLRVFTCNICGETYSITLPQITSDGLSVDASIKKLSGNNNLLTIVVTEHTTDDGTGDPITVEYSAEFNIINNPTDKIYDVGPYKVFVSITGNTISTIRIEP